MYTEQDLRKLVDMIDDAYRPHTRDNSKGVEILENFLEHGFVEVFEEKEIPFTYFSLRQKLDWERFCDLTGTDYYAINRGYEFRDSEIFYITESKAKEYGLL